MDYRPSTNLSDQRTACTTKWRARNSAFSGSNLTVFSDQRGCIGSLKRAINYPLLERDLCRRRQINDVINLMSKEHFILKTPKKKTTFREGVVGSRLFQLKLDCHRFILSPAVAKTTPSAWCDIWRIDMTLESNVILPAATIGLRHCVCRPLNAYFIYTFIVERRAVLCYLEEGCQATQDAPLEFWPLVFQSFSPTFPLH